MLCVCDALDDDCEVQMKINGKISVDFYDFSSPLGLHFCICIPHSCCIEYNFQKKDRDSTWCKLQPVFHPLTFDDIWVGFLTQFSLSLVSAAILCCCFVVNGSRLWDTMFQSSCWNAEVDSGATHNWAIESRESKREKRKFIGFWRCAWELGNKSARLYDD